MADFYIGDVLISRTGSPVVVAELGINHGGNLDLAKKMITEAHQAGAHLIKLQTHIPDSEMSSEAKTVIPGNSTKSIYEVISESTLTAEQEGQLFDHAEQVGATLFSTPFCREAVDRLEGMNVPAYKIGSGECNNYPLVDYVAKQGKPIIMSTGMNDITSIDKSVEIIRSYGVPFALLHTTNLYPTPSRLLRLGALSQLQNKYPSIPVGLSDHSLSNAACVGAVALGATILERHFTDNKKNEGPDIICSMDSPELEQLVQFAGQVNAALGGEKGISEEEEVTANFAFASVATTMDVTAGETLTQHNVFPIRPSGGDFSPEDYLSIMGKKFRGGFQKGTQLKRWMIVDE